MSGRQMAVNNLANGEYVALDAVELVSIPHYSLIAGQEESALAVVEKCRVDMEGLLNEVFQVYKTISYLAGHSKDISLELLWTSKAVEHQPYRASIRLFVIIRAIDDTLQAAQETVQTVMSLCCAALSAQKYEFTVIEFQALEKAVEQINDSNILSIVKEEKVENLQNQILPYCYVYDRLPLTGHDLSKVVNVLVDYPDCALSIQLIPASLSADEKAELDRNAQILETLYKGVADQCVGNVSFTLAQEHAETYKYYASQKSAPLFLFNILVFGNAAAISSISNKVMAQFSVGKDKTAALKMERLLPEEVGKNTNFFPLPWAVNEILLQRGRDDQLWSSGLFSHALYRLPYIITAVEGSALFQLPVGSDRISAGLTVNESGRGVKTYSPQIINAGDIEVGKLRSSPRSDTIGLALDDFAKHMLIVGTPGSGKTTFAVSLLDRMWKMHQVPFLVIEPAKNEYRALVQSIPDLQVFTPGKNAISPFVFNPFVLPKNVTLETYKSTLKTAFSAAVTMSTPLDKIFEESVNNCYSDFGWLDAYTSDDKGKTFNISDFIQCFQQTFNEIGYTGEAKNIGRAGIVRLNGLVKLFDTYNSIPIEDILKKPTVIELAAIENTDEKALIIALLLLSILAFVNANYLGEGGLKNVILLEEAHTLLDADTIGGHGDANPSAIAQSLLKRMLAEIRSYGVGIIIADQSPRKVSSDVVALTDIKMVFRLVESADKQIIADSTNMTETQIRRMAKLRQGEAFLFFHKLDEPEEVITSDYRLEKNIKITLSDESIQKLSTYWNDKAEMLRPYPQCTLCRYCQKSCDYSRRILAREISRRIFNKNIKAQSKDFSAVKKVFSHISTTIVSELNGEPFSSELRACVKVHLWRRIRYGTSFNITDLLIENSMKK